MEIFKESEKNHRSMNTDQFKDLSLLTVFSCHSGIISVSYAGVDMAALPNSVDSVDSTKF